MNDLIIPERRIHLPKYRDIETHLPRWTGGLAGFFTLRKFIVDANGVEHTTGVVGPFRNLIVDNGKNKFADISYGTISTCCHVGTGNTAPVASDASLETFLAGTSTTVVSSQVTRSSPPYYAYDITTWRFGEGVAQGTIAEVATSDQITTGDIFCRALILDGGGSPTTISVSATEWLDVTYEFRVYPDGVLANGSPEDVESTFNISGVSFDYTMRAALVTDSNALTVSGSRGRFEALVQTYGFAYGPNATLGAVTSTPSATLEDNIDTGNTTLTNATYSNGAFNRNATYVFGLDAANFAGGCRCIYLRSRMGAVQFRFGRTSDDATVDKTNTKVWTFISNIAWANAVIP